MLPAEIVEALERGATVVTGNQRAARTLRRAFDRRNRSLGKTHWQPPAILHWDAWTASLWRSLLLRGSTTHLLMNRTQEDAVWRSVLEADRELASLQSPASLAEIAAEAWRLLCQYEGQEKLRRAAVTMDSRAFQRWSSAFGRICNSDGLLPQAQLERELRNAVEAGQLTSNEVLLAGFDTKTPAQTRLMEAFQAAGTIVEEIEPRMQPEARILISAQSEEEELLIAARWIKTFLEQRPQARVALIVPGLETQRAEIDRVLCEVLAPELENIQAHRTAAPYEFSLGVPLAGTPMIATALAILRWAAGPLPTEQVSTLLLSPYLCMADTERGVRAEFDAFELRQARMLRPEVSVEWLGALIARSKRREKLGRLPESLRAIERFATRHLQQNASRSYAECTARMRELLDAAMWGANDGENSIEFQIRRRWESVLDEMATLDFDGRQVSFLQAVDEAERLAQQTIFAPESHDAPVQVMGPLETAGATFDAVWFLRAGDLNWPVLPRANPLLPWQMQRELEMPGTDAMRDGESAKRIARRIAESASTTVFSYSIKAGDGKQRPSPALAGLALDEAESAEWIVPTEKREPVTLEEIEDTAPILPLPDEVIHGGARILELQAACGFRAFAECRLWSTEIEPTEPGMDARERGTLIHKILELFWESVQTQHALREMTSSARRELLGECIARALQRASALSRTPWDAAYIAMQTERLHRLLGSWLELEMERAPFEVKLSEKEFEDIRVGPLRLSVRMDRVDIMDNGEVLIDYKTGPASPSDWLTDRPNAPQLPLYAILSDPEKLRGVAFGLVRAGEGRALQGYAVSSEILPKLSRMKLPSLEAQVEDWQRVLEHLAEEFVSGAAQVAPNHYPSTCERCSQRILCRLDASLLEENDIDEEFAEEERG